MRVTPRDRDSSTSKRTAHPQRQAHAWERAAVLRRPLRLRRLLHRMRQDRRRSAADVGALGPQCCIRVGEAQETSVLGRIAGLAPFSRAISSHARAVRNPHAGLRAVQDAHRPRALRGVRPGREPDRPRRGGRDPCWNCPTGACGRDERTRAHPRVCRFAYCPECPRSVPLSRLRARAQSRTACRWRSAAWWPALGLRRLAGSSTCD